MIVLNPFDKHLSKKPNIPETAVFQLTQKNLRA